MKTTKQTASLEEKNSPLPNFYLIDRNHKIVNCNETQAKTLGFNSPNDIVGKSLYDLYPLEVAYRLIANNLLVMDTNMEHFFEEEIPINGLLRLHKSHKKPFLIEGKLFGVLGASEDLTAKLSPAEQDQQAKATLHKFVGESILAMTSLSQKVSGEIAAGINLKPEDYLLSANAYFENLIASIPLHVYWLNREGKYLGCGNAQADTWKLSSRFSVIGKTNEYLHLHNNLLDPKQLDGNNIEVMTSGTNKIFKEKDRNGDGVIVDYLSSKAPIFDDTGVVVGMIGASIPISV